MLKVWSLTNDVDDWKGLVDNNKNALALGMSDFSLGGTPAGLTLVQLVNGTPQYSLTHHLPADTTRYLTIERVESEGRALRCFVYSDPARTNLLSTIRIISGVRLNLRYQMVSQSSNSPVANDKISGYVEDLELISVAQPAVAPTVTTQAVSNIGETTATANGNITDLGTPNPTAHGFAYSPTDTTPDIETDSVTDEGAASSTGAFTSDLTGLTAGLLYYMRAYATNTAGTSYGSEVTVRGIRAVGAGYVWQDGPFVHFGGEDGNEVIYNPPLTVSGSEDPGYLWTEGTELNVIDSAGDERSEEGTATGDTGPEGTAFIEGSELHYLDETAGAERTH